MLNFFKLSNRLKENEDFQLFQKLSHAVEPNILK